MYVALFLLIIFYKILIETANSIIFNNWVNVYLSKKRESEVCAFALFQLGDQASSFLALFY